MLPCLRCLRLDGVRCTPRFARDCFHGVNRYGTNAHNLWAYARAPVLGGGRNLGAARADLVIREQCAAVRNRDQSCLR